MSPELLTPPATGGRPSRASDVWATATLVVAILSRVPPFAHLVGANEALLVPQDGASSVPSLMPPPVADVRAAAEAGGQPYTAAQLAGLLPHPLQQSATTAGTSGTPSLLATLQRCWMREPADRPDASELADALEDALVSMRGDPRAPAAVPVQQALVDAMAGAAAAARAAVPSEARRLASREPAASRGGSSDPGRRAGNSIPASRGDDRVAGDSAGNLNYAAFRRSAKIVTVPWGGRTYFFRGDLYWRMHPSGSRMDAGYPLSIAGQWGVPGPIDASLEWHSRTYLFTGSHYFRLNAGGSAPDAGYPMPVMREWGVPGPVDAAFVWRGKTYTFHGTEYYRLNDAGSAPESGPHSIENDWGVPGPIDSALSWNGCCYFFKGAYYWRLNDACNAPDAGYPLLTEAGWGLPSV